MVPVIYDDKGSEWREGRGKVTIKISRGGLIK